MFNRRQKMALWGVLLLFVLAGLIPHWRYANGSSAGYHFIAAPPPAIPDSVDPGEPAPEYLEIKMIPTSIYNLDKKSQLSEEELRQPFIDVRRLLAVGAILFILAFIVPWLLRKR